MKKLYLLATAFITLILGIVFSLQPVAAVENLGIGTTAPFVEITNPVNGSQVSGLVLITADASSSAGVIGIDFQVDGVSIASASAYPYSVVWDASSFIAGTWHSLVATVFDYAGQNAFSVVSVQIAPAPTPAPTPIPVPTVSIINPLDGSTVKRGTVVAIDAQAQDSQGISKVEFYVNGSLTCADTSSSYTCNWKVPTRYKTSYTLTAKAYNFAGNTASSSIRVNSR